MLQAYCNTYIRGKIVVGPEFLIQCCVEQQSQIRVQCYLLWKKVKGTEQTRIHILAC